MSHASAIPPGGKLGPSRRGWNTPVNRVSDIDEAHLRDPLHSDYEIGSDPYADEPKWAAWKVTIAVVLFCGAFWAGIGYLAMRLFG